MEAGVEWGKHTLFELASFHRENAILKKDADHPQENSIYPGTQKMLNRRNFVVVKRERGEASA